MRSTFTVGENYTLMIGEDAPRLRDDPRSVHLQLNASHNVPLGEHETRQMLPRGRLVHVDGMPFQLAENTPAYGTPGNFDEVEGPASGRIPQEGFPARCSDGSEVLFALSLKPSHARAIASALLAAATEARE